MKKCLALLLVLLVVGLFISNVACSDDEDDETLESGDGGGGGCDTDQDCNNNGQCVPTTGQRGVCHCDERYAGAYCQHKRKNKLTAFLLSILLGGLAVDRFYLGYIGLGVVKLFLSVFGFVPACIANWSSVLLGWRRYTVVGDRYTTIDSFDGGTGAYLCVTVGNCLTCCIALGSVAWWLTDWILILKGTTSPRLPEELLICRFLTQ